MDVAGLAVVTILDLLAGSAPLLLPQPEALQLAGLGSRQFGDELDGPGILVAVSYTHLDVYKRQ